MSSKLFFFLFFIFYRNIFFFLSFTLNGYLCNHYIYLLMIVDLQQRFLSEIIFPKTTEIFLFMFKFLLVGSFLCLLNLETWR